MRLSVMRYTTPEPHAVPALLGRWSQGQQQPTGPRSKVVKVICPYCLGRLTGNDAAEHAEMERRIEAWLESPARIARARAAWMLAKGDT
jgi:hypothetical protein